MKSKLFLGALVAFMLTACGGGGGSSESTDSSGSGGSGGSGGPGGSGSAPTLHTHAAMQCSVA